MKNFKLLLLLSLLLPVLGCHKNATGQKNNTGTESSAGQDDENMLRDEIFVIHDEAMPRMGEIHKLKKQLHDISRNGAVTIDSTTRQKITRVLVQLDEADEGMMAWMEAFTQPGTLRQEKSHDEIMAYLKQEKEKANKVKQNIFSSIDAATGLLKELKN
ncbi:MAG: hypothetical protein EPO28_18790 [Saprospiraceae bacterium]|nr:MAG: hypothetical protein EPO28_18790 [Saprospiraceae bacterium]